MLMEIFSCAWKQFNIMILELVSEISFSKSWSGGVFKSSFARFWVRVVWMTWPLKCYWGGLTLFSLPPIAHAITGMHRHASVIDRPRSFPTAVMGNMLALGWSAQSLLSAYEKSVILNAISQTLLQMRYFYRLKTLFVKLSASTAFKIVN